MPARRSRRCGDDDVREMGKRRNTLVHTLHRTGVFFRGGGGTLVAANAALLSAWLSLKRATMKVWAYLLAK